MIGVFPGRGHDFFRAWLAQARGLPRTEGHLQPDPRGGARRLPSPGGRHLKPRMAAGVRAAGRVPVDRLSPAQPARRDLLAATAGPRAGARGASRLQSLYYTTRLARMAASAPGTVRTGASHPQPGGVPQIPERARPAHDVRARRRDPPDPRSRPRGARMSWRIEQPTPSPCCGSYPTGGRRPVSRAHPADGVAVAYARGARLRSIACCATTARSGSRCTRGPPAARRAASARLDAADHTAVGQAARGIRVRLATRLFLFTKQTRYFL